MIKQIRILFLLTSLSILFNSCGDSLACANDSLVGSWEITEVLLYGNVDQQKEMQENSRFTFNSDGTASYRFMRNSILQEKSSSWSLLEEDINCGFTKCKKWTIKFDTENFEVEFGDQTSDAHCSFLYVRESRINKGVVLNRTTPLLMN